MPKGPQPRIVIVCADKEYAWKLFMELFPEAILKRPQSPDLPEEDGGEENEDRGVLQSLHG